MLESASGSPPVISLTSVQRLFAPLLRRLPTRTRRVGRRVLCFAICANAVACGEQAGTPLPEPPALAPLDPSLIQLKLAEESILANQVAVAVEPGTLQPGDRVLVTNLQTGVRAESDATFNGSVRVDLTAVVGDALRVEVDVDAGRTPPTDMLYDAEALNPLNVPSCIGVIPDAFAVIDEPLMAGLDNGCDTPLLVDGAVLLIDDGGFEFDATPLPTTDDPLTIAPGDSFAGEVRLLSASDDGDVLRFDVELDGERFPIAVSLRTR